MKLIRNNNFNLYFLKRTGNFGLRLLLMGFSVNSMAQMHVSENTVLSIKENTVLHVADKTSETTLQIIKKETRTKSSKQKQKKLNKPLQPPIVKKDTDSEKKSVLSFTSKQKPPSALFYSGKTTRAALVNSGNFLVKISPPKKLYKNTIHSFLPNDGDQQIKISFAYMLPKQQIHLEEQITRPPPFLS